MNVLESVGVNENAFDAFAVSRQDIEQTIGREAIKISHQF